jgi:hypothetical protein
LSFLLPEAYETSHPFAKAFALAMKAALKNELSQDDRLK